MYNIINMAEVFDYPFLPEMHFLRELAEELEGTLHVITHAGYERNRRYIRARQKYFYERYDRFLDHVKSDAGVFHIIPAYNVLQDLLDNNPTPAEIREQCEEGLVEHLMGEPSEDYITTFQEFQRLTTSSSS